jgi:hypothetical protein
MVKNYKSYFKTSEWLFFFISKAGNNHWVANDMQKEAYVLHLATKKL